MKKPRLFEYKNINGNPQKFSTISKLYEEKEGTIVIPIFEFVKAYKPNKYTPVNNNTVNQAARTFNQFMDSKKIDWFKI